CRRRRRGGRGVAGGRPAHTVGSTFGPGQHQGCDRPRRSSPQRWGTMSDRSIEAPATDPVVEYKAILKRVLDNRPSGTRQRLAKALGKNRSFISQISNPAYPVPIPVQHLETMFDLCHFSQGDRRDFLAAYRRAHPRRLALVRTAPRTRIVSLAVP